MVTILDDQQRPKDLINKIDIKNAILKENAGKFQLAFNSPFYTAPLALDFGYKALTPAANQVLLGVYNPPQCYPSKVFRTASYPITCTPINNK
jgi:hypothetical protein